MLRVIMPLLVLSLLLGSLQPAVAGPANYQNYADRLLVVVKTPQLSPGQSGPIELKVLNPFNYTITNASVRLVIYSYATTDSDASVVSLPSSQRPSFIGGGTAAYRNLSSLGPLASVYLNFTVATTQSTRHGDFFNTGTYFVSTYLSFSLNGSTIRMASKGVFNQTQWSRILVQGTGTTYLNYSYLNGTLGYQGVLPDTSFTVNSPSPVYLLWITGGLAGVFAAFSYVLYRVEKKRRHI